MMQEVPVEQWNLNTNHIGRTVWIYDTVGSTNDIAFQHATDSRHDGLVILARQQQAGRGQYGRVWQAPKFSSVLMSVLLYPPPHLRRAVILTACAAVAVGECILQQIGLQAKIKWPNDLLIHGRKVCGILIEQGKATVIGIGLNVRQTDSDFVQAGLFDATSLQMWTTKPISTDTVAQALIRSLDSEYTQVWQGEEGTLEACWKWRIGLLGKRIRVELVSGELREGRLREMTFQGIELESATGSAQILVPEKIRHLQPLLDEGSVLG